ncbi:MAG: aKG-HExxH-type peptide beta-hydroxylase [Methylococcus sp.]
MFEPLTATTVRQLDQALREALADSLLHIGSAAASVLGDAGPGADELAAAIRAGRVRPGVFGAYYELVLALQAQDPARARELWRELGQRRGEPVAPRVLPFGHAELGRDSARLARLIDLGADPPRLLHAPPAADWSGFPARLATAQAWLAESDPALAAEVEALALEVIGAVPPKDATFRFGGASSFMLWGAITLNLERHRNPLDTLEGLVHEAAHLLLFGLLPTTPPVLNPVRERQASPLRPEPRPLLGIYHATFVCARLHHLYGRLRDRPPTNLDPSYPLEARRAEHRARFLEGHATLTRHARLTEAGRELLAAAHAAVLRED